MAPLLHMEEGRSGRGRMGGGGGGRGGGREVQLGSSRMQDCSTAVVYSGWFGVRMGVRVGSQRFLPMKQ